MCKREKEREFEKKKRKKKSVFFRSKVLFFFLFKAKTFNGKTHQQSPPSPHLPKEQAS